MSSNSLVDDGRDAVRRQPDTDAAFPRYPDETKASLAIGRRERTQDRHPHILLATTGQLPSTARLAIELHEAGAKVSLIAPNNHPARVLTCIEDRFVYRAIAPVRTLEGVLLNLRPDMVIPCDERTVRDLHELWRATSHDQIKLVIARSTAPADRFPTITSRAALLSLAQGLGVRVPPSMPLRHIRDLDEWTRASKAPFVLKADGSWAGFGVRVVLTPAEAENAFLQMTRPAGGRLAIREALLESNYFAIRSWLRRDQAAMSVQGFVDGWPANIGVACWKGEVLATVCAEAVATESATGPSTVVRIIDNPEMVDTAKRMVAALGLSGMIGFDFMIEAATGNPYLIEMNPRNTPICALRLDQGRDLAEALVARLADRPVQERPPRTTRDIVVFFPDTWQDNPASPFLHSGYHDVPWEEPNLVRVLMQPGRRERYRIFRLLRRVWLAINNPRESDR